MCRLFARESNSNFASLNGRNISRDERIALIYAKNILLEPESSELANPSTYAKRLLRDLENIKAKYRASEDDPDGFGIGTLHSISRAIEPYAESTK